MKNKKIVPPPAAISFIKSDKSRIIEVEEVSGAFSVVGVYTRINIPEIPLAAFHPKDIAKKQPATYKKAKLEDDEPEEDESDEGKNGGGDEKVAQDPLYATLAGEGIKAEQVNKVIEQINRGEKNSREICRAAGIQMRTFMKIYSKLKELGRIDAEVEGT